MYVIIAMDLVIEVMSAARCFMHMAAGITAMPNMEVMTKCIGDKDLHGTKGDTLLQDQGVS